jgi:hypothetical protein
LVLKVCSNIVSDIWDAPVFRYEEKNPLDKAVHGFRLKEILKCKRDSKSLIVTSLCAKWLVDKSSVPGRGEMFLLIAIF